MTSATNGTLRAAKRLVATSPRSTIGITPVTTAPTAVTRSIRLLGGAAGADHVVDEQHTCPRFESGAFDPLFAAALLLLLAHREPGLAGDHRDAVRQRIRAHGEPADGVELDPVPSGKVGDRTADDRQPLSGVDGELAVDVVMAELAAGQLERFLAMLVTARADEIEGGLPGVRSVGYRHIEMVFQAWRARYVNSTVAERNSSIESIGVA